MNHTESLTEWMSTLAEGLGVAFQPSSSGFYRLDLDNDVMLVAEADENQPLIQLWSRVLDFKGRSEKERDHFLYQALQLNLYRHFLGNATLAWHENEDWLILCRSLSPEGLDAGSFAGECGRFLDVCDLLLPMAHMSLEGEQATDGAAASAMLPPGLRA